MIDAYTHKTTEEAKLECLIFQWVYELCWWSPIWKRWKCTLIARFMGPTWGPSGADRTQVFAIWVWSTKMYNKANFFLILVPTFIGTRICLLFKRMPSMMMKLFTDSHWIIEVQWLIGRNNSLGVIVLSKKKSPGGNKIFLVQVV